MIFINNLIVLKMILFEKLFCLFLHSSVHQLFVWSFIDASTGIGIENIAVNETKFCLCGTHILFKLT